MGWGVGFYGRDGWGCRSPGDHLEPLHFLLQQALVHVRAVGLALVFHNGSRTDRKPSSFRTRETRQVTDTGDVKDFC